jgi:hypothetical protein
VCVAVLVDRFGTREQIDVDDHFANVANGTDRGTYRLTLMTHAKEQRRGVVSRLAVSRRRTTVYSHDSRKDAKAQRGESWV